MRKSSKLARDRPRRKPKVRFVILCEGRNTEPNYFRQLQAHFRNALLEINIIGQAGVPYTIAEKARDFAQELGISGKRRKHSINSFEEQDQVWAVFDRDEHPRFDEAIDLCRTSNVGVARSNPCFELWLILHHEEFDKPDGREAVQKRLEVIHPHYSRSTGKAPDCKALIANLETAEKNAEKQLRKREEEGSQFSPPSTTVHLLTKAIRNASTL